MAALSIERQQPHLAEFLTRLLQLQLQHPAPTPSEFQLQLSSAEDPSFFSLELPAASIARTTLVPPDTSLPQGPRTAINKRIQGGSNG